MKTGNASTNKERIKSEQVAKQCANEINGLCSEHEMENKYSLASLFMSILYHTFTPFSNGRRNKSYGNGSFEIVVCVFPIYRGDTKIYKLNGNYHENRVAMVVFYRFSGKIPKPPAAQRGRRTESVLP